MFQLKDSTISTGTSLLLFIKKSSHGLADWLTFLTTLRPESDKEIINAKLISAKKPRNLKSLAQITGAEDSTQFIEALALASYYFSHVYEGIDNKLYKARIEELIQIFHVDKALLENLVNNLSKEYTEKSDRKTIKIPFDISPIVFDFVLRIIFLNIFFSINNESNAILWLGNIFGITLITFSFSYVRNYLNKKHNRLVIEENPPLQGLKEEKRIAGWHYMIMFTFIVIGGYISYVLNTNFTVFIFSALGLVILYVLLINSFSAGKLSYKEVLILLDTIKEEDNYDADQNDRVIINLSSSLRSVKERLDAYVLESALFGALAFSGFLQIMAENIVTFQDLELFASNIFKVSKSIVYFEPVSGQVLDELGSKTSLFCLISFETLLCSVFFLGVIATRLRFSDFTDRANTSLSFAESLIKRKRLY